MKVDIEDVLFWMDAIRNSDNRYRTLESFWKGQVHSKIWLIENLQRYVDNKPNNIVIHGGWNGVLAALIFNSGIPVKSITSVDIDPACEKIANTINKRYEMQGKFLSVTEDMTNFKYRKVFDIAINTSTEHLKQSQYENWLDNLNEQLIILQSNDYKIKEHVRVARSLDEFIDQSQIKVKWAGSKKFPLYNRWMIIGTKS